jgi:N-acetylneuraminic acid mutarotase
MEAAAPAPTFDPPAGSYNPPITVTISDATAGTTIYYTTDGTPPATSQTASIYSGPITVSTTKSLAAIATAGGDSDSAVATATYAMAQPPPPPSGLNSAASGEWTWMGVAGSNNDDRNGVFTLPMGSFSLTNTPGGRYGDTSWVSNGYLWLFGGSGYDASSTTPGYLDDVWAYSPFNTSTKAEWAWMAGQTATYVASSSGTPPGGRYGASSWTDSNGNLWLFGGFGYNSGSNIRGYINDLWTFAYSSTTTGTSAVWAKPTVDGNPGSVNQTGKFGTTTGELGLYPGARNDAATWTDHNGNFWLFGGYGYGSSTGSGYLNDLWEFNPNSSQIEWTSKGGSNSVNPPGTYNNGQGQLGSPVGRSNAASWTDNNGDLWLFGGTYQDSQGTHYLNDLWMYDPNSTTDGNQWTLVSNDSRLSDAVDQAGACTTPETPACVPGSREGAATWTDSRGNFWLFGGVGYDAATQANPGGNLGDLSDLWEFTPSLAPNGWQYMGGIAVADTPGTYGPVGNSSLAYNPGGRYGAVTWADGGYLWLFGGVGYDSNGNLGSLSDLWVYQPSAAPSGRTYHQQRPPAFTLGASSISPIVTQGASGTDTITLTNLNGFTGNVALAVSGLPSGVTATFTPNPATVSSLLTLTASNTVPTGVYNAVITASSGSLTATAPVSLTVNEFACHIGYTIQTQWPSGFQAGITINNTGVKAITNWTLTWTFANGQKITQLWDGNVTQSGANVTVTNMSFNGSIPAGTSYTGVGFNGSWNNSTNAVPASFAVNGTACK